MGLSQDITGLGEEAYDLVVTDANGCTFLLGPIPITEPSPITITENSRTNLTCFESGDGAIDMNPASGGTVPLTYAWTGPSGYTGSGPDITGLAFGGMILP